MIPRRFTSVLLATSIVCNCWNPTAVSAATSTPSTPLRVTAIAGRDMKSTVECWTMKEEPMYMLGMTIHKFGDMSRATYTEIPRDADHRQGPYNAPNLQFFMIIEGNATITFPASDEVLHVKPNQLYIAADDAATSEIGHYTAVRAGSRLLQLPFKDGVIPEHTVQKGECGMAVDTVRDEL